MSKRFILFIGIAVVVAFAGSRSLLRSNRSRLQGPQIATAAGRCSRAAAASGRSSGRLDLSAGHDHAASARTGFD